MNAACMPGIHYGGALTKLLPVTAGWPNVGNITEDMDWKTRYFYTAKALTQYEDVILPV